MTDSPPAHANPRQLRVVWFLFFFQFAGIGIFISFINVYLRAKGLSGTEIGLLGMVSALFSLVFATVWGYISDRTGRPRLILIIGAVGAALVVQAYPLAQSLPAYLAIACLYGTFNSTSATLVDSLALTLLADRREDYGRYRLGGSFGYILTTITSGLIFERVRPGLPVSGIWHHQPVFYPDGLPLARASSPACHPRRQGRVPNDPPAGLVFPGGQRILDLDGDHRGLCFSQYRPQRYGRRR